MLQQAKLGIKPVVHIHAYAKLGIDMKVDDAALYRIGRKLLMQLRSAANQDAAPDSYPRKAPEPVREADPSPGSEQAARGSTPSDEGGGGVDGLRQRSSEGAVQATGAVQVTLPLKPRKEYPKQRPDGSQWSTRQSTRTERALISHATESEITGNKPGSDGLGAYFSTAETVTTM